MGLAFFAPSIDYIIPLTSVCLLQFQFIFPGKTFVIYSILACNGNFTFSKFLNRRHPKMNRNGAHWGCVRRYVDNGRLIATICNPFLGIFKK